MGRSVNKLTEKCNLISVIVLIIVSSALSAAGLLNPSWQVVDIKEFRAEHHHGLWLDCTRPERIHTNNIPNDEPFHCTYKFDVSALEIIDENIDDIDENSAAGESEHHQFFEWHKVVLVVFVGSLILNAVALCMAICASCSGGCSTLFSIILALSLFLSMVGDGVFFFAAHRVDNRFVQGLIGTYEQMIGVAFYMHLSGTILLLFSLILSIIFAYQILGKTVADNMSLQEVRVFNSEGRRTSVF
ncbi:unnamed protein product [Auanema sp. JU1783]|nr:unnamed protein product [Auanema sp. JU1783]